MSDFEALSISSLSSLMDASGLNPEELILLGRQTWIEQGILIASPANRNLDASESRALIKIAEKLYGQEDCQ